MNGNHVWPVKEPAVHPSLVHLKRCRCDIHYTCDVYPVLNRYITLSHYFHHVPLVYSYRYPECRGSCCTSSHQIRAALPYPVLQEPSRLSCPLQLFLRSGMGLPAFARHCKVQRVWLLPQSIFYHLKV